jgi:hypothetical protein
VIDFQSLHAKQLEIYQNFSRFKKASTHFINLSQIKLASVRRNALSVRQSIIEPSIDLPEGFRGKKINLII